MTKAHKALAMGLRALALPFLPATWRYLLLRKTKVRFYLNSGQHIDIYCTSWEAKFGKAGAGLESYSINGMYNTVGFDMGSVIAVKEI